MPTAVCAVYTMAVSVLRIYTPLIQLAMNEYHCRVKKKSAEPQYVSKLADVISVYSN